MSQQIEVLDESSSTVLTFNSSAAAEWYGLSGEATYVASRPAGAGDACDITLSMVLGGLG